MTDHAFGLLLGIFHHVFTRPAVRERVLPVVGVGNNSGGALRRKDRMMSDKVVNSSQQGTSWHSRRARSAESTFLSR